MVVITRRRALLSVDQVEGITVSQDGDHVNPSGQVSRSHAETKPIPLHLDLWLFLALIHVVLDFGRPIAATLAPVTWFPRNLPSLGDYFHMMYNILTPLCLLKLIERSRSRNRIPLSVIHFSVLLFVMGSSMHLVGDSVMHRLIFAGYKMELSVAENPVMKNLTPSTLIHSFEVLDLYDEVIGHYLWFLSFFAILLMYFTSCFTTQRHTTEKESFPAVVFPLGFTSALFYWYSATEAQVFPLFACMYAAMLAYTRYAHVIRNESIDPNGRFLLSTITTSFLLVLIWVAMLWNDETMRHKYTGIIYVPEPWTYFLHRSRTV